MKHAYILDNLMLPVPELIHIPVNLRQADILVKMVLKIFYRSRLAHRIRQPGFHKTAEDFILDLIESDAGKNLVKYDVSAIYGDVLYLRYELSRSL